MAYEYGPDSIYRERGEGGKTFEKYLSLQQILQTVIAFGIGVFILTLLAGAFPFLGAVLFGIIFIGLAVMAPAIPIFKGHGWNLTLNFVFLVMGIMGLVIGFFGNNIQQFTSKFLGVIPLQTGSVFEGVKTTMISQGGGVEMTTGNFILVILAVFVVSVLYNRTKKRGRR